MPSITTNPTSPTARAHRVQIAAEAVVSEYIRELSPPRGAREQAAGRHLPAESSPPAFDRSPVVVAARRELSSLRSWKPSRRSLAPDPCNGGAPA